MCSRGRVREKKVRGLRLFEQLLFLRDYRKDKRESQKAEV